MIGNNVYSIDRELSFDSMIALSMHSDLKSVTTVSLRLRMRAHEVVLTNDGTKSNRGGFFIVERGRGTGSVNSDPIRVLGGWGQLRIR
jgi:hypothetical protein